MKQAFPIFVSFAALIIAAVGALADADHPDSKGVCWADNATGGGRHVVVCNIKSNLGIANNSAAAAKGVHGMEWWRIPI